MTGTVTPHFEISIDKAHFHAYHGVFEQEQRVGNTFEVSATVVTPISADIASDNLSDTISYADLFDVVKTEMQKPSRLLEHVCFRIASQIRTRWPFVQQGEIKIVKLQAPISGFDGEAAVKIFF